jgi:hypothetical protein
VHEQDNAFSRSMAIQGSQQIGRRFGQEKEKIQEKMAWSQWKQW